MKTFMVVYSALLVAIPAFASPIDVGATNAASGVVILDTGQWLAQQFTLSGATSFDLTSISLGINDPSGVPYDLELANVLGSAGVVYWTSGSLTENNPTINTSVDLSAGTYYLIANSPNISYPYAAWYVSNGATTEIGGTVQSDFWISANGQNWSTYSSEYGGSGYTPIPLNFEIQGTATLAAVSEPGTFGFLAISVALLLWVRQYRRRSKPSSSAPAASG